MSKRQVALAIGLACSAAACTVSGATSEEDGGVRVDVGAMSDPNFLASPSAEGTVRITVMGGARDGYDRSCGVPDASSSSFSPGAGRAIIAIDSTRCGPATAGNTRIELRRSAGLTPGVYELRPDGDASAEVEIAPDGTSMRASIAGRLRVESVSAIGTDTALRGTLYGVPRWDGSDEPAATLKAAFFVRVPTSS